MAEAVNIAEAEAVFLAELRKCKRELWVVFNLQSNKIAFEYQSIIF